MVKYGIILGIVGEWYKYINIYIYLCVCVCENYLEKNMPMCSIRGLYLTLLQSGSEKPASLKASGSPKGEVYGVNHPETVQPTKTFIHQ